MAVNQLGDIQQPVSPVINYFQCGVLLCGCA